MEYRQLGQSEIHLSSITFGAWAIGGWMWGGADKQDAVAAIHKALEMGMTTIDTAAIHGQGHSESVVGEALVGRRDEVQILTKFGLRWDTDKGLHYFQPGNHEKVMNFLAEIRPIADERGITLSQLVINWTLHRPGITIALVGARNPQQVEENAGAADFQLSLKETEQIDTALGKLVLEM